MSFVTSSTLSKAKPTGKLSLKPKMSAELIMRESYTPHSRSLELTTPSSKAKFSTMMKHLGIEYKDNQFVGDISVEGIAAKTTKAVTPRKKRATKKDKAEEDTAKASMDDTNVDEKEEPPAKKLKVSKKSAAGEQKVKVAEDAVQDGEA